MLRNTVFERARLGGGEQKTGWWEDCNCEARRDMPACRKTGYGKEVQAQGR